MRAANRLFLAGLVVGLAAWTTGCAPSGGGGGAPPAPKPTTPEETPAVETEPGTPTEPAGTSAAPASGGWGTLKGRFVFGGEAPAQIKLDVTKDVEFCTKMHPLDETLVVNPSNGGIGNVVISLYVSRRGPQPEIHESFAEVVQQPKSLDNLWCRFEPHVVVAYTNQELVIGNKDEVGHNTKGDLFENPAFNETIGAGQSITRTFAKAERQPVSVTCSIHPWMKGYLVVSDHPYVAVTDADGNFEIPNVPTGRWTFQVWHEKVGNVESVNVGGADTKWDKGRVDLDVNEGDNDLGEIKVDAASIGG
ncbi:MAG: hypothetical protein J5I93_19325 [Pirellulaceae bacterium]|nr:hypothetical protein [Pirellulaceae bacterium]